MIKASYEELVKLIADFSKLDLAEVESKVAAKKAKLSDLISKEGAAQIVAAELGVSFDKQKVKIDRLLVGMRKISLVGKVIKIYPVRSFKTSTREGKVSNFLIADDSGMVKVVLWDMKHIKLVEEGTIKEDSVVNIKEGTVRAGNYGKELHLGSASGIGLSNEKIDNPVSFTPGVEIKPDMKKLSELSENVRAAVRAVPVQAFEPKFFNVCPECGRKPVVEAEKTNCATHGAIVPKERALMSLVLDDGTSNIRAVCFSDAITVMFGVKEEEIRGLLERKNEILGKEMIFFGRVRKNKLYDNLEFIVNSVEQVDPIKLVEELSKN